MRQSSTCEWRDDQVPVSDETIKYRWVTRQSSTCEVDGGIHLVIVLRYETRSQASCVLSPSSQNVSNTIVFTPADELHTTQSVSQCVTVLTPADELCPHSQSVSVSLSLHRPTSYTPHRQSVSVSLSLHRPTSYTPHSQSVSVSLS